jgi:hypothetical protein
MRRNRKIQDPRRNHTLTIACIEIKGHDRGKKISAKNVTKMALRPEYCLSNHRRNGGYLRDPERFSGKMPIINRLLSGSDGDASPALLTIRQLSETVVDCDKALEWTPLNLKKIYFSS